MVERHLSGKVSLPLAFAVPDHPWVKGAGRAAVQIAMTVMRRGAREGTLARVAAEEGLNTDAPAVALDKAKGTITAKLTLGADTTAAVPLLANEGLSSPSVKLHGAGFIVTPERARALGLGRVPGLERHILDYRNGRDLAQRSRGVMVIDLYGLRADEVLERFPAVYQHIAETVRPEREGKRGRSRDANEYADNWWLFGKVRTEMRDFTAGLPRHVGTVETARHRWFRFLDASVRPANKLVALGLDRPDALAVLSSRLHVTYAIAAGGWLGAGNDPIYVKTRTFDPFPFPALLTDPAPDAAGRASLERLRELGERLDALRAERLGAHRDLTMTGLYNRLERRREALAGGAPLTEAERADHERARTPLLAELHDAIDRAVLAAYGWDDLAPVLVGRPGGTVPSAAKGPAQEAAEDELLSRPVALNRERAEEEARGHVRWLRPDYQAPRLRHRVPHPGAEQIEAEMAVAVPTDATPWPSEPRAQFGAVRALLDAAAELLASEAVARSFKGRLSPQRRARVEEVLAIMADLGIARAGERDGATLFQARR